MGMKSNIPMKKSSTEEAHYLLTVFKDRQGISIREHSEASPVLLVLLRHVGCSFCRKAMHELSVSLKHINRCGYRVALVHMDPVHETEEQLRAFGLDKLPLFHDPDRRLYRALGLPRTPVLSLFNRRLWQKGRTAQKKYGFGLPKSDPRQLPGAFLVNQGRIVAGQAVLSPDEHPDFLALLIRSEAVA